MTTAELLYALTLAAIGGGLALVAASNRRESLGICLFFQGSFWFRAIVVLLNSRFHLLVQKAASDISMTMINQDGGMFLLLKSHKFAAFVSAGYLKFTVESLLNLPGIRLFEDSLVTLNLTNAFVGAIGAVIVFAYLRRLFDRRVATCGLLLTSLYPAALNFSIFGLRDIIIYCLLLSHLLSFAWLVLRKDHRRANAAVYALSLLLLAPTRLAFIPLVLVLPAGFVIGRIRRELRELQAQRRRLFLGIAMVALSINGSGLILGGYEIVLHHLGYNRPVTPTELLKDFALARASRGTAYEYKDGKLAPLSRNQNPGAQHVYLASKGQGAASVYLPIETLSALSLPARVALQVSGFMLLPFPWQLTSPVRILALFDSFFVWFCLYGAWRVNTALKRRGEGFDSPLPPSCAACPPQSLQLLNQLLLAGFVLAWFCFGSIIADAGNAFRMRLSVLPFAVLGASLFVAMVLESSAPRQLSARRIADKPPA